MTTEISLRAGGGTELTRYVALQLHNLFPANSLESDQASVASSIGPALDRMRPILAAVRAYQPDRFDHFHSMQYASFLYLLSTEVASTGDAATADRIFYLNRCLNSIDLYHAVNLGEVFLIAHGLGSVFANAVYGNRVVVFQNVTIGRVGDNRPTLGSGVVLFPGSGVTGRATIGDNCVIAAGVQVNNIDVPSNTMVTQDGGRPVMTPLTRDYLSLYFRS